MGPCRNEAPTKHAARGPARRRRAGDRVAWSELPPCHRGAAARAAAPRRAIAVPRVARATPRGGKSPEQPLERLPLTHEEVEEDEEVRGGGGG